MRQSKDRKSAELHRRGADRVDGGAEAAPVPAQHALSRAPSGSQPSPGICDGSPGQSHLQRLLHLFLALRKRRGEALEAPSAEGSRWSLQPAWGKGLVGLCDSATGSHSGRPQHGTSHVTCQLARLSPL